MLKLILFQVVLTLALIVLALVLAVPDTATEVILVRTVTLTASDKIRDETRS